MRSEKDIRHIIKETHKKEALKELLTVGDDNHPPTMEVVDKWKEKLSWAVKHKQTVIALPYWMKLKVIE